MSALSHPGPLSDARDTNIDAREVAHYERLAASWWDTAGPFWPLHRLNALRTDYLRDHLARAFGRDANAAQPLLGLDILDVGCGGGIASEAMARLGANVHGIDVVERNIEVARLHAQHTEVSVRYEVVTASRLAEQGLDYDVVLNMEVVEHVPDVAALVGDCARLLRPSGVMALATINRTALSWLFAIVGAEYVLRWLPRGTHRWRRFVAPGELQSMLASNDLTVTTSTGVRVNPFNRTFALTRNLAVNYMLLARPRSAPAAETGR